MDLQKLSKEAACALEDHKLISWDQQEEVAQIINGIMAHGIKNMVKDFYDR